MGIRVLMLVIPIILAVLSFFIYKKFYTLKGEKMDEVIRQLQEKRASEN